MAERNGHAPDAARGMSPSALRTFMSLMVNRLGLAGLGRSTGNTTADLECALGYQPTLRYADFKQRYERGDIAHTIVRAYPDATWSQPPSLYEDDQEETQTPFEAAWQSLVERVQVFRACKRVDLLANLGQYAILLVGLRGQANLQTPASPVRSPDDVLYLQPYSEEFATIEALEQNAALPTYGQPSLYRLTTGTTRTDQRRAQPRSVLVHASRIIHVAEDALDDDIYGIPRLAPVYNQLDNLVKVVGGGAFGFYLDSRRRIVTSLREGYQLQPQDREHYRDEVEEYATGMKDFLNVMGMDVSQLPGVVASPKEHADVILSLIASTLRMSKSQLIGAEQGTLASAEEEGQSWKEQVSQRQQQFAEPIILRPFVDRLLLLGALPQPGQPYQVDWGNLFALSEVQQADVADKRASAYNKYEAARVGALNAGISPAIPPQEFRAEVANLPPESEYELEMPEMLPTDEGAGDPEAEPEEAGGGTATDEEET